KHSILRPRSKLHEAISASIHWLIFSLLLSSITFSSDFIIPPSHPNEFHDRGWPFLLFIAIAIIGHTVLVVQSLRQFKGEIGIRRLELQFLILNFGIACIVALAFSGLGTSLHSLFLKRAAFPISLVAVSLAAWGITFHRIFDVRQVFLSVLRRPGVLLIVGFGAFGIQDLLSTLPQIGEPTGLVAAVGISAAAGFTLDRISRSWLGLDGVAQLTKLRGAAI